MYQECGPSRDSLARLNVYAVTCHLAVSLAHEQFRSTVRVVEDGIAVQVVAKCREGL